MRIFATVKAALAALIFLTVESAEAGGHAIEVDRPILAAEEGLLLGNGDLSVSVYQTADQIVWRFGKGDVWDRRLDLSDNPKPPVWFSLYRWPDPSIQAFATRQFADCRHGTALAVYTSPKITPLSPPTIKREGDLWAIEQVFPPDPLFRDGFRYLLAPFVPAGVVVEPVDMKAVQEARLHILPGEGVSQGQLAVAVATTNDPGGPAEEIKRIRGQLGDQPAATLDRIISPQ